MSTTKSTTKPPAKSPEITLETLNARFDALEAEITKKIDGLYAAQLAEVGESFDAKLAQLREIVDEMKTGATVELSEESAKAIAEAFQTQFLNALADGAVIDQIVAGTKERIGLDTAKRVADAVRKQSNDSPFIKVCIVVTALCSVAAIGWGAYAVATYEPQVVEVEVHDEPGS